jgi:NAD(P)-dependent dehydrogenase (short-subunit alcohol dehydrogenase family)
MQIKDNVFIITGGASGLGLATAKMIIAHEGKVVLADMNAELGHQAAEQLGPNALFQGTNVADAISAEACFSKAISQFGAIHGLVNCAGIAPAEKVITKEGPHRLDNFTKVITVNLIGSFNMARLAAQAMCNNTPNEDNERGIIISTASIAAFEGQIGQAAYAASKGGVIGMMLPLARELARFGIRVLTIAPGIMGTPMLLSMPQDVQDSLGKMVPFPSRLGKPEEYAQLVKHMTENSYLNGEVIRLDGAIRMGAK